MQSLNILVVSASQETIENLTKEFSSFQNLEYRCIDFDSKKAKSIFDSQTLDIIIVDVMKQQKNGLQFIDELYDADPDNLCPIYLLYNKPLETQIMLNAMQHGVREFVQFSKDPQALGTALKKHGRLYGRYNAEQKKKSGGKVISVFSAKGGAGASTIAFNLAHELRQLTSEPVVLFDPDQAYSNLKMFLNILPEFCLGDLAKYQENEIDNQILNKLIVTHSSGLDVLVSCKSVYDNNAMLPLSLVNDTLAYLTRKYSYVIVDIPSHTLDSYHQAIVEKSDTVLLVANLDVPTLYRTIQYIDLARPYIGQDKLKLIVNQSDLQGAYGLSNKDLEKQFDYPIYARLSDNWELNLEANSLGVAMSQVAPNAMLVKEIKSMARQITGTITPENSPLKPSSFLSKLSKLKLQPQQDKFKKDEVNNALSKA
jgi:pilus assembly protein CpaE